MTYRPQRHLREIAAILAACGALGCGDDLVSVRYRLVGPPPASEGRCPQAAAPSPLAFAPEHQPNRLRLTYRSPGAGLRCDVMLDLGAPLPVIAVPEPSEPVDVTAELFQEGDGVVRLVGRGDRPGVRLDQGGTVDIAVTPTGSFSCATRRASIGRAFHAATVLPDGRVLITGGVVGGGDGALVDAEQGLFVTSTVELYDPVSGQARLVSAAGITPRAFHQTMIVDADEGAVHLALVGGLTVAADPRATPALIAGRVGDALRWMPTGAATGAATEVYRLDLEALTLRSAEGPAPAPSPRVLPATGVTEVGRARAPLVAGGVSDGAALGTFEVVGASAALRATGPLVAPRLAGTVTDLGDGRALLWGGQLYTDPEQQAALTGELLVGLDEEAPTALLPTYAPDSAPAHPRLHHAAAPGTAGTVVVAGGFAIAGASARDPAPVFAQLIDVAAGMRVVDLAPIDGVPATPAGYLDAFTTSDGSVIVSGGNPAIGHGACPIEAAGVVCAIADAHRVRPASVALERVPSLQVARYGHRTVTLADGRVLVTGGLRDDGGRLQVIDDLELFDPRTAADDPIADLAPVILRAPGDVARTAEGAPAAPCELIETAALSQ